MVGVEAIMRFFFKEKGDLRFAASGLDDSASGDAGPFFDHCPGFAIGGVAGFAIDGSDSGSGWRGVFGEKGRGEGEPQERAKDTEELCCVVRIACWASNGSHGVKGGWSMKERVGEGKRVLNAEGATAESSKRKRTDG